MKKNTLLRNKFTAFFVITAMATLFVRTSIHAQLPQCDRIYMDRANSIVIPILGALVLPTTDIYGYNPSLPASATNPSLNTIQLPLNHSGLTVGEVLGSGSPTLTFYTVVRDSVTDVLQYWYYSPTTLTWVNTNHTASAVNFASGGGNIYNLRGDSGIIYKYNGTGNDVLLTTVNDFINEGPFDLIADCPGNFYLLNLTGNGTAPFLRKYDPNGALLQNWTVNNPNGYSAAAGFGVVGTQIYVDNFDQTTYSLTGIASGAIAANSADFTTVSGAIGAYGNGRLALDFGSCASSVPVLPMATISTTDSVICTGDSVVFTSTISNGGPGPQYQWRVNGNPVAGATGPTFTFTPNDGDVITLLLTGNDPCATTLTGTSNAIKIKVDDGKPPTLSYDPSLLCKGRAMELSPKANPPAGTFSATPTGLNIDGNTGTIVADASNAGTYIVTYKTPVDAGCPVLSTSDTVVISPEPPADISLTVFRDRLCQADTMGLATPELEGASYKWAPPEYFYETRNDLAKVTARVAKRGIVHVTVTNSFGCVGTDSIVVDPVHCCTVDIPNVFSPNGDGQNDKFTLYAITAQEIKEFSVYNRWGQRVYYDIGFPGGWDGNFNGNPLECGTYFYTISYACSDGNTFVKKGDITLMR